MKPYHGFTHMQLFWFFRSKSYELIILYDFDLFFILRFEVKVKKAFFIKNKNKETFLCCGVYELCANYGLVLYDIKKISYHWHKKKKSEFCFYAKA